MATTEEIEYCLLCEEQSAKLICDTCEEDVDDNPTGDWQSIDCPYCGAENTELWDGGGQFDHDDGDTLECHRCEQEFVCKKPEDYGSLEAMRKPEGYKNSQMRFEDALVDFRRCYEEHVLEAVTIGNNLSAYYLKKPGDGRMCSTLIIFSAEGITIIGDMVPCRHGVNSSLGYGIGWFSDTLSPGYLGEKFADVPSYSSHHALLCAIQEAFARERAKQTEAATGS